MGDKVLSRAFDLAKQAGVAEHEGNLAKARDLLTASIEAFRAVLLMPGFIGDERTRTLLETEITNLQKRKALMLGNASEVKKLEARLDKLANPGNQDALQERLTQLKGLDKPGITQDELASRLKTLKGEDGSGARRFCW